MKLSVFPSSIETSRALILRLVEIMNEEPDRVFNIAVSGGNTPALMFDLWANEYMEITPWDRMRIYWVDERCVPPDDSDSNYGMMRNLLLGITPILYENVFRIRGEAKPAKEAVRYSDVLFSLLPFGVVQDLLLFIIVFFSSGVEQAHLNHGLHTLELFSADNTFMMVLQMNLGAFSPVPLAVSVAVLAVGRVVAIRPVIPHVCDIFQHIG